MVTCNAKDLIDNQAVNCDCNAVKFQKRELKFIVRIS